jgi:hypothetical protein
MSTHDHLDESLEDAKHNHAIAKIKLAKEYTEADNIIRYLTNPQDDSIKLTDKEKRKFDLLKEIHGYRMRFARKSEILNIIKTTSGLKESQCYKLMQDCEYVFGSIDGVNKAYERQFLLEASRKNIELAFFTKKSDVISKALREHYVICGLNEVNVEMPDFSALEPNNYNITIPENQRKMLDNLLLKGFVNVADLVPNANVTFDITAKDVTNTDGK